ncbi:dihydrofolate reductase family protein [Streptomyces sp. SKN60]|uniref:dihydrofolate reductase family protein n=1 Tax=Streptomyces sp. SKN60 TaxID=2855506 RepID=UPI002245DC84|nr:dihydrofolate reductase family protein [Streptomyces sp. SKN60]MCX2183466.1 dihydrofolate reductase family protein [Streptomyces sp. SKN60]
MRKLTYYVACSLDGFIGDPNGDASSMFQFMDEEYASWMNTEFPETVPTAFREAAGLTGVPNKRFDTVIQGMGSYRLGLEAGMPSPYGHLREIVATRSLTESPDPNVELFAGDLAARVRELKAEDGPLDIWLCGGGQVARQLVDEVDELVIKSYPQIYGSGMPLFGAEFAVHDYVLENVRSFGNGVVVRWYARKR